MPGNPLGLARDDVVIEQSNSTKTALMYANIGGSSLCTLDVGGSFGRELSAQGEKAMVAFAVEWLTKLYGSEAAAAVKKSSATRWNAAPFALGAMSAAAPADNPAKGFDRAVRLHLSRRRGRPMKRCGERSTAPGKAASALRSGVAADRCLERSGAGGAASEAAAAQVTDPDTHERV